MKHKIIILFLFFILFTLTAISAENITVQNTHNTDINDQKYINPNDYYFDENGTWVKYTSDTGSFNNVTMSNGYNAYAIQDGGYIETNDSKSHPSFWNDTYYVVDANDSETVVGHWYYASKMPIGEYLKILFFRHYDDLLNSNRYYPNIPSSIFVQMYIWDLYKCGNNTDKLVYRFNREAVNLFNEGFRVNNTGNIQWINETVYRVFDFLAFKNVNGFHKDLWGFQVKLFNKTVTEEINVSDNQTNITQKTNSILKNVSGKNNTQSENKSVVLHKEKHAVFEKPVSDNETGNPIYLLAIMFCAILAIIKKEFK